MILLEKKAKIGGTPERPRVTLWNRIMHECGMGIGTTIKRERDGNTIIITPDAEGKNKVSRVMNHGSELPVIDLRGRILDGWKGTVTILYAVGRITIKLNK